VHIDEYIPAPGFKSNYILPPDLYGIITAMETLINFFEYIFHFDKHLSLIIQNFGAWTYMILFAIIFAETGFVVTPFLPGDSLLFATGAFSAIGALNVHYIFLLLSAAAILGDTVNYALGKFFGHAIIAAGNGRFVKKEYVDKTHRFFEKYGGRTIILARFVPIVRTFAPFVAGIGEMNYFHFLVYNVTGGIVWVAGFIYGGFYFGNMPFVKDNFTLVIFAIIVLSILPGVIEVLRHRIASRGKAGS
jgi:membrane-associated protein